MVKLAQTIGATGIAQSTRLPGNMGSHVIEVRQNLYSDKQMKAATRVFPFSDISYSGAEVAAKNSIIASCYVPTVVGIDVSNNNQGQQPMNTVGIDKLVSTYPDEVSGKKKQLYPDNKYMCLGFGMSDYIFGITCDESRKSAEATGSSFNEERAKLYDQDVVKGKPTIDGTNPLMIKQYLTEEEALDEITAFPSSMFIGYVIGPRDVKLYYTETAIAMMARRLRRVVEACGPFKPIFMPLGLGHLAKKGSKEGAPWRPKGTPGGGGKSQIWQPSPTWNAGAVQYKAKSLKATGSYYIPQDQVPYSSMRRNFKYNHIMTQVGLELIETMQAIGIDLGKGLSGVKGNITNLGKSGAEVAALQMLFASMFGSSTTMSPTSDFVCDENTVAAGIKDDLGMLFNSGHIHIDPGVFTYTRSRGAFTGAAGKLSDKIDGLTYKGRSVSPQTIMAEFIAKYLTFIVCKRALESYMSVPLFQCHWMYVGSPKPQYVTEQLQMNYRSDVYFDGDNSMPFTLIPTRLNPGEVLSRVPCYIGLDAEEYTEPNKYLGVRDPLPYGSVIDIRFSGDKPLTTTEERDYTFTPIIEADAHVSTQYRNSRTVNCAVWPRPTHYSPGATRLGAIYGMLSDNASVGGHYYWQPLRGLLVSDSVDDKIFRAMKNSKTDSDKLEEQMFKGTSREEAAKQADYWDKHTILPTENPQDVTEGGDSIESNELVLPATLTGRKANVQE